MDLIKTFNIPPRCVVNTRIAKKTILDNNELKSFEKKIIREDLQDIFWAAGLKPVNSNIPALVNNVVSFDEIHFIRLELKNKSKLYKTCELLQAAIPYPLVLLVDSEGEFCLNTADKRINQNEKQKRTIEHYNYTGWLNENDKITTAFLNSLLIEQLKANNLMELYNNITERIVNLNAAQVSGEFKIKDSRKVVDDVEKLNRIRIINDEISLLRNKIKNETQFSRKVEMNVELKNLENEKKQISKEL